MLWNSVWENPIARAARHVAMNNALRAEEKAAAKKVAPETLAQSKEKES